MDGLPGLPGSNANESSDTTANPAPPQATPPATAPSEDKSAPAPALAAVGSGIILTSQGHILTNNHVVSDAQWILVVLPGSTEKLEATVLGRDVTTDLAILKIDKPGVRPATFGNSDMMKPGDVVLAIGNAFGLSQTVTSGIISATMREDIDIAGFENYIQTDAPINPGNSGGALVNTSGEVIGINTAMFSQNGGSVGVGFAVNGNLALKIARKLCEKGHIARGFLGLTVSEVTHELADLFMTQPEGALVNDIVERSPADQAGLKPGDIIVSVNGTDVKNPVRFRVAMADLEPESRVNLKVIRMGSVQLLEATLSEAPNDPPACGNNVQLRQATPTGQSFLDGITIDELSEAQRRESDIPKKIRGVRISYVEPETTLHSRLRPGMVICEVGGLPVDSVAKAIQARWTSCRSGHVLLLRVWNSGQGYQFTSVKAD